MALASCFGMFFSEYTFLFRYLIFEEFLTDFHIFWLSFFFGEPSATRILLGTSYDFRTCTFFRKVEFSWETIPKSIKQQVCFLIIFFDFYDFSGIDSRVVFSLIVDGKRLPKWIVSVSTCLPFSRPSSV